MSGKLMELSTRELLQKFGAGDHKPGSGSAAALQGMLSAKLLLTVIDLTAQEKLRHTYAKWLPQLESIAQDLESRIFPRLEKIFQDDSDQFDKTIKLRTARDNEPDPSKRRRLIDAAQRELRVATETPLVIANLCVELSQFGLFVFANGFKSARGDTGVAINGAVAAVAGSLSIVNLNLLTCENSTWKTQIQNKVSEVRRQYDIILSEAIKAGDMLIEEVSAGNQFDNDVNALLQSIVDESRLTNALIEQVARDVQNLLWKHRKRLWKNKELNNPAEVLRPKTALNKILGFEFSEEETLGTYHSENGIVEVAGIIDSFNKIVRISKAFSKETRNFTAAHELGHALFHKGQLLHRDKPIDGLGMATTRDTKEQQADKFAAYFLLPEKQVVKVFQELFGMEKFVINEETVFSVSSGNVREFRRTYTTLRHLTRLIATTEFYAGQSFQSMSEIFQVSTETIAIRLEELGLVEI